MADLASLENILGITFKDASHLRQALVHRSYLNENPGFDLESNERLEFLGDSLLNFVVAEKFYMKFPQLPEGDLTRLRLALVRRETLARISASLRLGDYLYLGKGEDASGGRQRQRNLAAALEAVIGAILIDQGFNAAKEFILRVLSDEVEQSTEQKLSKDPKSRLQEIIQAELQLTPIYQMVDITGPDHDRVFRAEVFAGGNLLGQGKGKSKQAAEREAAKAALKTINYRLPG